MAAWFKPKRYGYGATPATWQGWAVSIAFAGGLFALVWLLIGFDGSAEPDAGAITLFFIGVAILVAALWIISRRNTDGEWRWRWGDSSNG